MIKYAATPINIKKMITKNAAKPPPPLLPGNYGSDTVPSGLLIFFSASFFF